MSITVAVANSESGPVTLGARIYGFDGGEVKDNSVSVSFSPESLTIGGSTPSIAKVSVGSTVAPGSTYTVWVYGQDAGGTKSGTPISLTVATPTLKLRTHPTASVAVGSVGVVQSVVVIPGGGLQGTVTLSASIVPSGGGTAPSGLTVAFSPSSATIDPNDDSIISSATIAATSSVPTGTYTATVTATDGSVSAVTTVTITVSTYLLTLQDTVWSPNATPAVGSPITDRINASITPAPSGNVTYSWSVGSVFFSSTDATNSFSIDTSGDYLLSLPNGNITTANPPAPSLNDNTGSTADDIITGIFNGIGWYIVEVSCTATLPDNSTLTSTYYIGGLPPTAAASASSADAKAELSASTATGGGKKVDTKATSTDIMFSGNLLYKNATTGNWEKVPVTGYDMEKNSSALSAGTVEVERGTKCTFSSPHSGKWYIYSPNGSAAWAWFWQYDYTAPAEYSTIPILLQGIAGTSTGCFFIEPGASTVSFRDHTTSERITFQVGDPTQTASDEQFSIQPVVAGVKQSIIKLNIPAKQVGFPFTAQPSYSANAIAAEISVQDWGFLYTENHHDGIGAWGDSKYYPDNADPLIFKARNTFRRCGANFNFGVMMQASGFSLNNALYIAQQLVHETHPIVEQYAIAAGWTWEKEKEPALDYKGHSVFTFNLTEVPNGGSFF
jgi:hypothetical protein